MRELVASGRMSDADGIENQVFGAFGDGAGNGLEPQIRSKRCKLDRDIRASLD
jgi:hypothetical protein